MQQSGEGIPFVREVRRPVSVQRPQMSSSWQRGHESALPSQPRPLTAQTTTRAGVRRVTLPLCWAPERRGSKRVLLGPSWFQIRRRAAEEQQQVQQRPLADQTARSTLRLSPSTAASGPELGLNWGPGGEPAWWLLWPILPSTPSADSPTEATVC